MRKQALEHPDLLASETWEKTLRIFKEMAFSGVYHPEPSHPKIIEIDAAIEPYIDEAYNGTLGSKEALDKAEQDVNKVLKS